MQGSLFARDAWSASSHQGFVRRCVSVLDDIVARRCELAAVLHPLGFLCLPLVREPGWGVCIHVWTSRFPARRPTTSGIHAHSWDLESFVLYGVLGNAVFDVAPAGTAGTYQLLEVVSRSDGDEILPTGRRVSCTEVSRDLISSGEVYRLPTGVLHETFLGADPEAATLVLAQTQDLPDRVLGPVDLCAHVVTRQRCTADDTRAVARMVRDRLVDGGGVVR
ncbi:hypothetical protein POF50_033235 [Streptomyces sp. SL13]|jgi:hypothetical protein|uniref:Uncharacterized protein n=1 Tax=Streptantibioticus silvisoli TaxID=2705255 RepID=A0AA90H5Y0_9ACTN|nr:hypothetical protein [Streptantibioticus silvisoli]MDI5964120.1 hypothetical protein [Streptantibioticus silvisoli]MDI5974154.1 hypothetical protein [Streptantibioticus silvisoli]